MLIRSRPPSSYLDLEGLEKEDIIDRKESAEGRALISQAEVKPYPLVYYKAVTDSYALLADLQNTTQQLNKGESPKQDPPENPDFDSTVELDPDMSSSYSTRSVTTERYEYSKDSQDSQPIYQNQRMIKEVKSTSSQNPYPELQSQNSSNFSNNLSELDSLLEDLNSARYASQAKPVTVNGTSSFQSTETSQVRHVSPQRTPNRPAVESLLDELQDVIPEPTRASLHIGHAICILRGVVLQMNMENKLKTHSLLGHIFSCQVSPQQARQPKESTVATKFTVTSQQKQVPSSPAPTASSATQELDDLMASLSDFKVNASQLQPQSESAYAKPQKPQKPNPSRQLDSMLGTLQSDMDKEGVKTTAKGHCGACNKPIVGQVVTALAKTWHPEHFTCAHCNQELGSKNFFERDGQPYCETDYHSIFSPRCAYCNGPILDKCVTALEKTWHPEHFFCAQCGKQFGEDGFHEKDGKPYCKDDYFDLFAPKCGGCNRPIMENYISALNGQWHPECFVCRDCRQPFNGGSFFDHEGMPYCETHYHAKRGSLCAGCHKPITGRCITAMFRKFHPEHFVCSFCLKQLNKGTFKEQNDKPYCHPCFEKLFG
ncbi:Paxillin [Nymphon striatum]|nr:Paxillin [Nymphon striatum]